MEKKSSKIFPVLFLLLIVAVLACSMILVWPVYRKNLKLQKEVSDLEKKLNEKSAECIELKKFVHDLEHNPRAVEKVAREKFNLCKEGEVVIKYKQK
jgi:cell division protein FtsL